MPEKLRFYLDEMVDPAVSNGLRRRGIDTLTTQDAEKLSSPDEDQLSLAHREGRVLFTMDEDFLKLHAAGRKHSGIAHLHQQRYTIGRAVHGLIRLWESRKADEMVGQVAFL